MPLNIAGHEAPQAPVRIVGTWEALRGLRDALSSIVDHHATDSAATFFINDGEGYAVLIRVATEQAMADYGVPYIATEPLGHKPREGGGYSHRQGETSWPR